MRNVISKIGLLIEIFSEFKFLREQINSFRENPSVEGGLILAENIESTISKYEAEFK